MNDLEKGRAGPVDLAFAAEGDGAAAPEWVTLLPAGPEITGCSGCMFRLTPEAARGIVAAFEGNRADLPVDLEHSTEVKGANGDPAPAVGWIKAIRVGGDGTIEGRIDWTDTGRRLIAARACRYLSPAVLFDRASRTIRSLTSAGLTNKPDFHMAALAREGEDAGASAGNAVAADTLGPVAAALGLDVGAGRSEIVAAASSARSPDPARFVPIEAVRGLIAERGEIAARMRAEEAAAKVDAAISGGCLPPAMRDWAVAHCRQDPASFAEFLDAVSPAFAHLFEASAAARAPRSEAGRAAERVARQLGLTGVDLGA